MSGVAVVFCISTSSGLFWNDFSPQDFLSCFSADWYCSSAVCVCGSGSNTEKTQTIPAGTTPSLRNFTRQAEFLTSPPFPFLRDILVLPAAMLFVALS